MTLLTDIETTEKITIEKKSLTLDLNGKTWKRTGTLLKIDSGADVTIKNGTIDFTVNVGTVDSEVNAISLPAYAGSLVLEDVNINVTDGKRENISTVWGYAVDVRGGSLNIRGNGNYGEIYVSFSSNNTTVKLYDGTYKKISLQDGTGSELLDKGYIFVNADEEYINANNVTNYTDFKVIACTHEEEELKKGYYIRCGAECEHRYDENGNNKCSLCQQSLAAQVTDANGIKKYYIDLNDTLENAPDSSTVKLLKAVSGNFTVSTPIKLDCNGNTFNDTLTVRGSVTLESLLPEGYAFWNCYTKNWINDADLRNQKSLTNFTIKEAPIQSVTAEEAEINLGFMVSPSRLRLSEKLH